MKLKPLRSQGPFRPWTEPSKPCKLTCKPSGTQTYQTTCQLGARGQCLHYGIIAKGEFGLRQRHRPSSIPAVVGYNYPKSRPTAFLKDQTMIILGSINLRVIVPNFCSMGRSWQHQGPKEIYVAAPLSSGLSGLSCAASTSQGSHNLIYTPSSAVPTCPHAHTPTR